MMPSRETLWLLKGRAIIRKPWKSSKKGFCTDSTWRCWPATDASWGPATPDTEKPYSRRNNIRKYLHRKLESFDQDTWEKAMQRYQSIDISQQSYQPNDQRLPMPKPEEVQRMLDRMGKVIRVTT
jgi:hypothetical protein